MGAVWEATHTIKRTKVALKFLRGGDCEELRQRFVREARAAVAIEHDNVIEVIDVFELEDHTLVIVMPLLEGQMLADLLATRELLSLEETAAIMVPVVDGVAAAHAAHVVHRDLKPANVFLVPGEGGSLIPKVLDFGIAKLLSSEDQDGLRTQAGIMLGTRGYLSPEQAFGEGPVDGRTDVWALGVMRSAPSTASR